MSGIRQLVLATIVFAGTAGAQDMPMPANANDDAHRCDRVRVAIPAELAGWSASTPVTAGATARGARVLAIGRGVAATLRPAAEVRWATPPGKDGVGQGSAGLFAFQVVRAGRYRVALGSGAWVDVVQGSKALTSVAHGHGPQCSGIRKMVDFDLKPGRYLLQIAGNKAATLPLLVARLPG